MKIKNIGETAWLAFFITVISLAIVAFLFLNIGEFCGTADDCKAKAIELCKKECINTNKNLSSGPCLSEKIISGWVCDVAHNPREPVDNENQCSEYGKSAKHFVELDENCKLIRAV